MKYEPKEITLKNGQLCTLRNAIEDDAEEMIIYLKRTNAETTFMARYEDEITVTVDEEKAFLAASLGDPQRIMISALIGGSLVASAGFSAISAYERTRHRAEFGISILKEFWNLGLGSVIMSALLESAKAAGYEQLELEVVAENERAFALYKKFGFEVYGTRENTFKYRDGSYSACHLMLKKL